MKKKNVIPFILFSIILFLPLIQIRAQNEKKTTIFTPEKSEGISNEILNTHLKSDSTFSKSSLYLDLYRLNPHLNPYHNILRNTPISLNYDMSESYKLSQKLYITPYNRQITHLGLGNYNNIGASLQWLVSSDFSIEGGGFLSLQYGYTLFSRHIAYGYNWGFNYDVTNKLQLSIYGQHMINNSKDLFLNYSNEFPKTNIGTSLQYKAKENSKIGVGMEYQYDQSDHKWKSEAKGKVSFGF